MLLLLLCAFLRSAAGNAVRGKTMVVLRPAEELRVIDIPPLLLLLLAEVEELFLLLENEACRATFAMRASSVEAAVPAACFPAGPV